MKARRVARLYPRAAFEFFCAPIFNSGQILAFMVAVIGLAIVLQRASPTERDMQATDWAIATQAFGLAMIGWALISLICAPFAIVKRDRQAGGWIGNRRVYHEPVLVDVSVWGPEDAGKGKTVLFPDVENGAFVSYYIDLDPPVPGRASSYLERYHGEMNGVLGSIRTPGGGLGKVGGRGSIGLVSREACLQVILDPQTVKVTARVYMTGFSMGDY